MKTEWAIGQQQSGAGDGSANIASQWRQLFRTCLLMYGKRPSLSDIVKYVGEA